MSLAAVRRVAFAGAACLVMTAAAQNDYCEGGTGNNYVDIIRELKDVCWFDMSENKSDNLFGKRRYYPNGTLLVTPIPHTNIQTVYARCDGMATPIQVAKFWDPRWHLKGVFYESTSAGYIDWDDDDADHRWYSQQ